MPEPRGELDTWLNGRVEPLLPPPGTFERVSRRARRLRARRALVAAAGALAVAAIAAVAVPQLVIPAPGTGRPASATGGLPSAAAGPQHPATAVAGSTPAPATAGPPVPAVTPAPPALSVTFVGAATGWVMGQSLPAGQCDQPAAPACIVLRRTDSGGATWRTVHAPPAHGPNGPTGVSQVRFLTRSDGWAFGPQLWATHNAGRTWTQIATGGLRVTALEARGRRVFAVWARCAGTGAGFASHCTSFTVYSSPAGSDAWAPALSPVAAGRAGGAASLLLTGTTAYLLSPAGSLFAGPLTGAGLQPIQPGAGAAGKLRTPPCPAGPPQPDGQPSGALLAAGPPSSLNLLCAGQSAGGQQGKTVYASSDGGQTWRRTGRAPAAGTVSFLSASPTGALVLATSLGIEVSTDGGATWSAAGGTTPPGGFAYAGMTTDTQGVAVPAGPAQHGVWLTYDGGRTWQRSPAIG
jgi:BNR/Asp-box repeat protein